jgi:hypothetical protein
VLTAAPALVDAEGLEALSMRRPGNELGREAAGTPNALVVSVSGDGGYNEVVNGVMSTGSTDAVCTVVAIDMEKGSEGAFKETVSVVRTFAKFRPYRIQHTDSTRGKIDSLLFADIPRMAEHATLPSSLPPGSAKCSLRP